MTLLWFVRQGMASKSHLYEFHAQYGKMTDFAGFDMPLWYSSIIDEHMAVRNAAGLFDVSHMPASSRNESLDPSPQGSNPTGFPRSRMDFHILRVFFGAVTGESITRISNPSSPV